MKIKNVRWHKGTHFLAAMATMIPLILGAQTWNLVGNTNYVEPFPNVNVAGESSSLYVSTTNYPSMTTTVLHWNGIDWSVLGSPNFTGELYNNEVLTVMDDTPYFLTNDAQGRIVVMYFDGSQWTQLGTSVSTAQGSTGSITSDGGQIYVAFYDQENNGVTVKLFNGSDWIGIGLPGMSDGSTNYVTLDVHEGIPYVACQENFSLSVLAWDGSNWNYLGAPQMTSQYASSIHLKKDANHLYVSYEDQATGCNLRIMEYLNGTWEFLGESSLPIVPGQYSNLGILNGMPVVGFREITGELSVMLFQNGTWEYLGASNISNAVTTHADLCVSGQTVFVGYRNVDQSDTLEVQKFESNASLNVNTGMKIEIFPNPVTTELWIRSETEIEHVRICDQYGSTVFDTKEAHIDISSLARGSYLLKITTHDRQYVERLVKL